VALVYLKATLELLRVWNNRALNYVMFVREARKARKARRAMMTEWGKKTTRMTTTVVAG